LDYDLPLPPGGEGFNSTRFGPKGPVFEFEIRLKHSNGRGNLSEAPKHKAPRYRHYMYVIVCFLLVAGDLVGQLGHERKQPVFTLRARFGYGPVRQSPKVSKLPSSCRRTSSPPYRHALSHRCSHDRRAHRAAEELHEFF
jgi:hypothetical protein